MRKALYINFPIFILVSSYIVIFQVKGGLFMVKNKGLVDEIKDKAKEGYAFLKKEHVFDAIKDFGKLFLATEFRDNVISLVRMEIKELKHAIIKSVAFGIFLFSGIAMAMIGLAQYLAAVFPALANGLSYMIFGVLLVIVALVVRATE
jgi:hypothetical protein